MFKPAATLILAGLAALAAPGAMAQPAPGIISLPLQPVVPAAQRTCAKQTPAGLGYTELRSGTGPKPGASDYVLIDYIGYLAATGAVFDQNTRTPMKADGVIAGFSQGLQMMPRGSVWRFCIPAALGYGTSAAGPIPASSDLVFQIELLDSRTEAEVEAMRKSASAAAAAPAQNPSPPAGKP